MKKDVYFYGKCSWQVLASTQVTCVKASDTKNGRNTCVGQKLTQVTCHTLDLLQSNTYHRTHVEASKDGTNIKKL